MLRCADLNPKHALLVRWRSASPVGGWSAGEDSVGRHLPRSHSVRPLTTTKSTVVGFSAVTLPRWSFALWVTSSGQSVRYCPRLANLLADWGSRAYRRGRFNFDSLKQTPQNDRILYSQKAMKGLQVYLYTALPIASPN